MCFRFLEWRALQLHRAGDKLFFISDLNQYSHDFLVVVQFNWDTFINPDANAATPGHLMVYPFRLTGQGEVTLEPLTQDIPDFPGANMFGGPTDIPYVLTT
jgi:hypothetical protein